MTHGGVTSTNDSQGSTTISRSAMSATPAENGGITSMIRTIPSVQFSNKNRQSLNMAEISAANISINGAKYYQNNFQIDGVNVNFDVNPNNTYGNFWRIGQSPSQGISVDSDFIESVTLHDSDVSAKYGNFQGGVIEADTRNPRDGFHGKISLAHTRDSWTKMHIADEKLDSENTSNYYYKSTNNYNNYSPEFTKWVTRVNLEGMVTDNFGLLFGFSDVRSKIPLGHVYTGDLNDNGKVNSGSHNAKILQNYFLKAVWYVNDKLTITPQLTYAPQSNKEHMTSRNSIKNGRVQRSGGWVGSLTIDYEADFADITNKISFARTESSKDADNNYLYSWRTSNLKYWGTTGTRGYAYEGAGGDLEQKQKTYSWNLDFEFKPFDIGKTRHQINSGLVLSRTSAMYASPDKAINAGVYSLDGSKCKDGDPTCSQDDSFNGNGQYIGYQIISGPGKSEVDVTSFGFYVEDNIEVGKWKIRPGVRVDGDDWMKKITVAPRFTVTYDLFGNGNTLISAGANRYYGRSLYTYEVGDNARQWMEYWHKTTDCDAANTWWPATKYENELVYCRSIGKEDVFRRLKIPYDDELSIGIKQQISNFELGIKYINRRGKDGVIRAYRSELGLPVVAGVDEDYMTYTNEGETKSHILNFTFKSKEPIQIGITRNTFELGFQYLKTDSNYDTFKDRYYDEPRIAYYNGKQVEYRDLPKGDFEIPWTLNFTTITEIPSWGFTWSNFWQLRAPRERLTIDYDYYDRDLGYWVEYYKKSKTNLGFTWDMRFSYEKKIHKDIKGFVNLDIYNILNRKNESSSNDGSYSWDGSYYQYNDGYFDYDAGRQFWLEVGVKW